MEEILKLISSNIQKLFDKFDTRFNGHFTGVVVIAAAIFLFILISRFVRNTGRPLLLTLIILIILFFGADFLLEKEFRFDLSKFVLEEVRSLISLIDMPLIPPAPPGGEPVKGVSDPPSDKSKTEKLKYVTYAWSYKLVGSGIQSHTLKMELIKSEIKAANRDFNNLIVLYREDPDALMDELDLSHSFRDSLKDDAFYKTLRIQVFKRMIVSDQARISNIIDLLKETIIDYEYNAVEGFYFVVSLIQSIHYDIPDNYLEINPPYVTLANQYGDCDTKSLLGYLFLNELGYNVVFLVSDIYTHAMLGANLPASGAKIKHRGRSYYTLEMTNLGWMLGDISPDMSNLKHWEAVKF